MNQDKKKAFGYATQAWHENEWITHAIFTNQEDAMEEAKDLLKQGYATKIKNIETPLDWIKEEASFEDYDEEWTKGVIIHVAEMLKK